MYTRNSDLTHYKRNQMSTNCGSYALRLNEWYSLDDEFNGDIYDWIWQMSEEGYADWEISNIFRDILLDCMLNEFGNELEICDGAHPTDDNIELIAFNTFCTVSECNGESEYDFHFRVFRDGTWKEKCGSDCVRECDMNDWGDYIGEEVYLYHRLGETNEV